MPNSLEILEIKCLKSISLNKNKMKKYLIIFCIWLIGLSNAYAQIVAGEYFWNTDPGVGMATPLTALEIASGVSDESFDLSITTPSTAGQHILYVRFKQNDTLWSQAYPQMLLVGTENLLTGSTNLVDSSKIVQADYYWNDSTANVHSVILPKPSADFLSSANIGTNGLPGGQHVLNIRVKDKYGLYSPYSKELVFVSPENLLSASVDLVDTLEAKNLEYYWNDNTSLNTLLILPPSDNDYSFTFDLSTSGALEGSNVFNYRIKDKYGLWTSWKTETILVMGEMPLPTIDSIKFAIKANKYSLTGQVLSVNFKDANDQLSLTFKSIPGDTNVVVGNKEITTKGLTHGLNILSFRSFASDPISIDYADSDSSALYQVGIMVDTTIKLQIGEPHLANNTLSTEFCPGGIVKIPIDTTGNWPRNNPSLQSTFTMKLSNNLGQNFLVINTTMNVSGDTLIGTIPDEIALASGYKVMVESTLPMIRDTASATLTIGLTITPYATNATLCEKATLSLGVNSNVGASYSWVGPAGFSASGNAPERVNIPANGGGVYTVNTISTIAGCTSTASINITVNPLPIITLGSNSPLCVGQSINLTSSSVGNSFLSWVKGASNIGGSGDNKTISNVALADSGYYKVAYLSSASCLKIDSIKVIVKPLPVLSGISTNSPICSGNTLSFGLNATAGSTYIWSGPNGFNSNLEDQTITNAGTNTSGIYSVTVTLNGCEVNTTIVNVVNQTPTANTTTSVVICQNQALTLGVSNTPSASYLWSGPFFAASDQNPLVSNKASTSMSGTYSVTVTLSSCSASNTVSVTVKPLPEIISTSTNSPICAGNNLVIGVEATSGSTYSWSGPNDFSNTTDGWSISSATTNASGTYSLTVTLNACSINTTVLGIVNQTPVVNTNSPVSICDGFPLTLQVNTTPSATYNWTGPSFTSSLEDPIVSNSANVSMSGTYNITVTLGTCSANGAVTATINPKPILVITNQNTSGNGPVNITVPAATAGSTLPYGTSLSYFTNAPATNVLSTPNAIANSGTYYIKASSPAGCVDVKPIVVNICGSTFNLVSPTDDYNSGLQVKASTVKITASNKISGTANITYRSAQAIELSPGFLAANGTVFLAEKGICN
jgi:hypothetical protein